MDLFLFGEGVNNFVSLDFFPGRFLPTLISQKPSIYKGLWALPTPGLWNEDGGFWQYYKCRRDKDGDSSIPFRIRCPRLSFLQILCQSFSIEDCQLIQYLIPVPVSLGPLLCHIQAGQIEHLFQ